MSTPSPAELRAEFERLILTDLLGPSKPDEVLPGVRTPVREGYLVGMLAPKGTIVDPNRGDDDDLPGDDEGGAPGREGQPAKVVLFPSSIGFTSAVMVTCSSLTVSASWGRYEKIPNPDPVATGEPAVWANPPAPLPRRIVTLFPLRFATARSSFPSRFRSPVTMATGPNPTAGAEAWLNPPAPFPRRMVTSFAR